MSGAKQANRMNQARRVDRAIRMNRAIRVDPVNPNLDPVTPRLTRQGPGRRMQRKAPQRPMGLGRRPKRPGGR